MKRGLAAFGAGVLFAVGLGLAGMMQPTKVVGFLDFSGAWDASLAFVMAGGIGVLALAQLAKRRLARPLFADRFPVLARHGIDGRLVLGASIFGVGWGLGGFCPGPAIASCGAGLGAALLFVPAMLGGMAAVRLLDARRHAAAEEETGAASPTPQVG
ncbi:MAG TPA: DUF6691 family protein [Myxococcales bacterium]|nr:DUF6691 family protein [Myxococcales bacterium]